MREILLLCEYPTLNGGERSMLATLDGVRAAGFAPVVMAPPAGPLSDELARRGAELFPFSCHDKSGHRVSLGRLREELAGALRRRRPALLHANSLAMGRLSGPVAAELALPSVAHLRDIVGLSAQAVADLGCHRRLLAVSEATRAFHVSQGLSAANTHVLYNGVDLGGFRPRPPTGYLHHELALPPDAQLIGTIGQIGLRKGQDVLLHAAAMIAGHDSPLPLGEGQGVRAAPANETRGCSCAAANAHYLIVGERHSEKGESRRFESQLRGMADGPLAGRVHFLGRRDDVSQLLGELTLLVHPARQEPLGRVLLEAAAAGVAVVATAVGGTPEIFPPHSGAARLVPPDDPAALAAAMLELLDDGPLRKRLSAAARRRAEQYFDIRSAVVRLLGHYEALLCEGDV